MPCHQCQITQKSRNLSFSPDLVGSIDFQCDRRKTRQVWHVTLEINWRCIELRQYKQIILSITTYAAGFFPLDKQMEIKCKQKDMAKLVKAPVTYFMDCFKINRLITTWHNMAHKGFIAYQNKNAILASHSFHSVLFCSIKYILSIPFI